jgi:fructose-1,6-bisphosphatase/inositol monophosphatase family enzyme
VVDPIDPIDGLRGFAHGLPEFAIRVALLRHDAPALGLVFNPATGQSSRPNVTAELGAATRPCA